MPERQKKQIFHINLLKEWLPREGQCMYQLFARTVNMEESTEQYFPVGGQAQKVAIDHLSTLQQQEVLVCIPSGLFQEEP